MILLRVNHITKEQMRTSGKRLAGLVRPASRSGSTFMVHLEARTEYPHVTAIAPLNEPAGFYGQDVLSVTRQFWYDSYGNIRYPFGNDQQGNLLEVIHDAFQPLGYWNDFANYPQFEGVAMDTHIYEVFSNQEVARNWDQHIESICNRGRTIESWTKSAGSLWTVVGEWSLAAYDCAPYLNGRGVGSRYDGTYPGSSKLGDCAAFTGDGSHFFREYKDFLRRFWEAQVTSFEKGQGWIYWTWKTEKAHEWSYSAGLEHGWIPKDVNDRIYPGICG
ncbi:exo-1,3-beta-glucanase [Tulasnella sp. 418]|nr:exo-1,3-beta-glucanase [Tulasnella sp. 418]